MNDFKTQYLGDGVYANCDQNPGHIGLTTSHHRVDLADNVIWLDVDTARNLLELLQGYFDVEEQ